MAFMFDVIYIKQVYIILVVLFRNTITLIQKLHKNKSQCWKNIQAERIYKLYKYTVRYKYCV